jgi:hypothetical protein
MFPDRNEIHITGAPRDLKVCRREWLKGTRKQFNWPYNGLIVEVPYPPMQDAAEEPEIGG